MQQKNPLNIIFIIIIVILAIALGFVIASKRSSQQIQYIPIESTLTNQAQTQEPVVAIPSTTPVISLTPTPAPASSNFVFPKADSVWKFGQSMQIKIKTNPVYSHCSNGFYLYTASGTEVSSVGIVTEPGILDYTWSDVSKVNGTCGTGAAYNVTSVAPGSYKVCLRDSDVDTGVHNTFYCSDVFTITS